jgi:predicted enzyme related to lactoylglutathione lyase
MTGFATLAMISLDAQDPAGQARFYSAVLGWEVLHSEGEYAMIGDGSTSIGFGKVPGFSGPGWPDEATPKRYHLDFYVEDLDKAEEMALSLGATKPSEQPQPDRWRVLLDPAGHPLESRAEFDLCIKS